MRGLANFFVTLVQRLLPDPYLFAVLLTFVVFLGGVFIQGATPTEMARYWGNGFFDLLTFAMQMTLVLVTGHVLASSPPVAAVLRAVGRVAGTPSRAIVVTTVVSAIASWINWGFGLVVGALLAKEMARQVERVDYRLLIASAYSGFLVWHAGLAGSVPLTIATEGHFLADQMGVIPVSETIFTSSTLIPVVLLILVLPLVNRAMMPKEEDVVTVDRAILEAGSGPAQQAATVAPAAKATFADWLENSWLVTVAVVLLGYYYLFVLHFGGGGTLNLNMVILLFLTTGLLFHLTPRRYLNALAEAVKGAGGIILQFPFYAGIMGMMVSSGLAVTVSQWFVNFATADTLPFWSFVSGGFVNLFVPSGGGQWAVQGPVMIPAAKALGASLSKTAMGVAWGDAWTNMIQPFWALPALGIAGLNARDIMGYCVVVLLVSGVVIGASLLIF